MTAATDPEAGPHHRAALLLAEAGWAALQDRIVLGLCHEINGRVSSLLAAGEIVQLGEPLPRSFDGELPRLEAAGAGLAQLVGDVEAAPVPLEVGRVMRGALELLRYAHDPDDPLADPVLAGKLPPVLAGEGRLLRALALLLDRGRRRADTVRTRADTDRVCIEVSAAPLSDPPPGLAGLFEMDGGGLDVSEDAWTAYLPTLAAARARPEHG